MLASLYPSLSLSLLTTSKVNSLAAIRVALLGGSDSLRSAKRAVLETHQNVHIVFDSEGYALLPQDFREVNFDVAIIEQRLNSMSAFDFIKILHTISAMDMESPGRMLVASQFHDTQLRLTAIEAGAVDCIFISDGPESLVEKVLNCSNPEADFAIRELIPVLGDLTISQEGFQNASVALDTLDKTESKVVGAFCQLKDDSDISISAHVSKIKVRATLLKVQKLLMLDTRSQLLLRMYRLGALAF